MLFLNVTLRQLGGCFEPGDPLESISYVNKEKRYLFAEVRSVEETCTMLQLDGILYQNHTLKIRRP